MCFCKKMISRIKITIFLLALMLLYSGLCTLDLVMGITWAFFGEEETNYKIDALLNIQNNFFLFYSILFDTPIIHYFFFFLI